MYYLRYIVVTFTVRVHIYRCLDAVELIASKSYDPSGVCVISIIHQVYTYTLAT